MSRIALMCSLVVMIWLILTPCPAPAQDAAEPRPIQGVEVITPKGDYALVTLQFDVPEAPGNFQQWQYLGGLRDGRMAIDHGMGIREPGGTLTLKDGRLTGSFTRGHGRRNDLVIAKVTVNASVRNGNIEGKATVNGHEGIITGRITPDSELAKHNAIPADKGWPQFLGPIGGGTSAQTTDTKTIPTTDQIQLRWRTEETDIGQGVGSISRFMHTWRDANGMRTCSGSSSPVAGDGMIFLSYFVPSPTERDVPGRWFDGVGHTNLEAARKRLAQQADMPASELPDHAMEKQWIAADDVVLAIDAATGKTLWKAVMRDRGLSIQHHKIGPFNMSPAYGEGRIFAIGMSGWLYAFDAKTGKPLWEVNLALGRGNLFSSSAVAVRGVVIAPHRGMWAGFDPATGKQLWQSQLRHIQVALSVWRHGDTDYLIGSAGSSIVCLHPRTGEVVWTMPLPNQPQRNAVVRSAGRGMGSGGISIHGNTMLAYVDETDPAAENNAQRAASMQTWITAWQLDTTEPKRLWSHKVETLHGGNVPVVVHDRYVFTTDLQVLNLSDGKLIARGEGTKPGNGGYLQAMQDLVMVRRDGTHGRIETCFYRVGTDGNVTNLNPDGHWSPPHGGATTSYHHPIMYPLIDGRLFLRQFDGIYCWDLRQLP